MNRLALFLVCGCAAGLAASAALADPPGRVGRVRFVEGEVSFLPPGEQDWTYADRNFPVTAGESFWTDDGGRVELQAGPMEIRADSDTELDVLALDYGQTRLGLTQGSIDLRLWRAPEGGVTISTPAGDVEIDQAGVYRIDVGAADENGAYPPVELTVFEGDAGAPSPQGFADVQAGEAALIYAGYDPQYEEAQDAAIDDWARDREQSEQWQSQASFDPSMTGYEDLDGYGEFVSDPDYGRVWYPTDVPDDWAPYRFGHWAYVNPWGYTWIDDQPWGFAPFHYGRWARINGRWGWAPGQASDRSTYAPALVAFFGIGSSIGWTPLAPDEDYRPTYDVSDAYRRRINAGSVRPGAARDLNFGGPVNFNQYHNADAAVVVSADALSRGARIQNSTTRVAPFQLMQATPVTPRTIAPPTPRALAGGAPREGLERTARPNLPPSRLENLRAVIGRQPAGSNRPPVISGSQIAPPPAATRPVFIAPAQVRNPNWQARRPVTPPAIDRQPDVTTPSESVARPTPPAFQRFHGQPFGQPNGQPSGQTLERREIRPTPPVFANPETGTPNPRPFERSYRPPQTTPPASASAPSNDTPEARVPDRRDARERFGRPMVGPNETAPSAPPAARSFRPYVAGPSGSPDEAGRPAFRGVNPPPTKKPKPEDTPPQP